MINDSMKFREEDHTYWIGLKRIPSVSEIIAPVCSFDGVNQAVLERKAEIGKATHLLCEWHDLKQKIDRQSIDPAVAPYFEAWKKFSRDMKPKWLSIEERRYSPKYAYAGTSDRFGLITKLNPSDQWVIDIKTVAALSPATALQTAAYLELHKDQVEGPMFKARRGAVQLKPDGTYRFEEYRSPTDWPTFLALLTVLKWKSRQAAD